MKLTGIFLLMASFSLPVNGHAQAISRPQSKVAEPAWRGGSFSAAEFMGIKTIRLWETRAPQANGDAPEDAPTLTLIPSDQPNGTAVIVAPGGGYTVLATGREGRQVADWFAARGVTAFVLKYRLGPKYTLPVPLLDSQRAIRYLRAHAKDFQISPNRIGMIGFSAGGHLTAITGTLFHAPDLTADDPIDRMSDRPDFMVLGYPAVSNYFIPNAAGEILYCKSLKRDPCKPGDLENYLPALHVTSKTPPTFLFHTSEDDVVPAADCLEVYTALRKENIPSELHIFGYGPHGTGLGGGDPALDAWPALLEAWLRKQGLLTPDPSVIRGADIPVSSGQALSIDTSVGRLLRDPCSKRIIDRAIGVKSVIEEATRVAPQATLREAALYDDRVDDVKIHEIARALADCQ